MPFFLPPRLVEFEYLTDEGDPNFAEVVKGHEYDYEFAFFVVHFGWSLTDYESITPKQKALIIKAWEDKMVADSNLASAATLVATINAHRKKGKPLTKLWKKTTRRGDTEQSRLDYQQVIENEKTKGKSWVQRIYNSRRAK